MVDVFALVDNETVIAADTKREDRQRFIELLREAEKYLSDGHLKERIENMETLEQGEIVKNAKKFFNTIIKLKTKLL